MTSLQLEDLHHGSHRRLLRNVHVDDGGYRGVADAIIVPTVRPTEALRTAITLARDLETCVVALCSGRASAGSAVELGRDLGARVIALDIDEQRSPLPSFRADQLIADTPFERNSDTSLKRNLGLVIARLQRWQRILFLDDDIGSIDPGDASAALGLLDEFDVVGVHNVGFPDNSVVCHANRILGGEQDQFVGTGAMAIKTRTTYSYFPQIYNEDWLFMLGMANDGRLNVAEAGSMRQDAYDPYADAARAGNEEFGDCIGEGLFWLLDLGRERDLADREHWADFLARRSAFLEHLLSGLEQGVGTLNEREPAVLALKSAKWHNAQVTAQLCATYVERWRTDLQSWRRFLLALECGTGAEVLGEWTQRFRYSWKT